MKVLPSHTAALLSVSIALNPGTSLHSETINMGASAPGAVSDNSPTITLLRHRQLAQSYHTAVPG